MSANLAIGKPDTWSAGCVDASGAIIVSTGAVVSTPAGVELADVVDVVDARPASVVDAVDARPASDAQAARNTNTSAITPT